MWDYRHVELSHVGLSPCRTIALLDYRPVGLSPCTTIVLYDDYRHVGLISPVGLSPCGTIARKTIAL